MLEKSRSALFFQWFVVPDVRKVGSLKRRVRSHVVRGEIKNCTLLWRKAHFQVKMYKTRQLPFLAVLMSKNCTHISKSKPTKHLMLGPLYEVPMSKNCTPLWREAHFQVKIYKAPHGRTTLWSSDVEKLHAAVAWSIFVSQNVQNNCVLAHFLKFRCRNISQVVS